MQSPANFRRDALGIGSGNAQGALEGADSLVRTDRVGGSADGDYRVFSTDSTFHESGLDNAARLETAKRVQSRDAWFRSSGAAELLSAVDRRDAVVRSRGGE